MPRCDNCGTFVSAGFHRVFSVDGVLHACTDCRGRDESADRAASYHPDSEYLHDPPTTEF